MSKRIKEVIDTWARPIDSDELTRLLKHCRKEPGLGKALDLHLKAAGVAANDLRNDHRVLLHNEKLAYQVLRLLFEAGIRERPYWASGP